MPVPTGTMLSPLKVNGHLSMEGAAVLQRGLVYFVFAAEADQVIKTKSRPHGRVTLELLKGSWGIWTCRVTNHAFPVGAILQSSCWEATGRVVGIIYEPAFEGEEIMSLTDYLAWCRQHSSAD